MLLALCSHLFLLRPIYKYVSSSVFTQEQALSPLEIQPVDSHRSNPAPVAEEVGEECFSLKINAGQSRLPRPFLLFTAEKAPPCIVHSPPGAGTRGAALGAALQPGHRFPCPGPPPALAFGGRPPRVVGRVPRADGGARPNARVLPPCRTVRSARTGSAEAMTQNWQLKRPRSRGSGTSARAFCTARGFSFHFYCNYFLWSINYIVFI